MIRVKAGAFSFSPPFPPEGDGGILRWHLLDHMPEQFQLPGIVHAHRWIADGAYRDSRLVTEGPLADIGNVMHYLFGDPVQQTFDDFLELGQRLADVGRFPRMQPGLQLRLLALLKWYASPNALISPEVVPWRPHRGIALIVEQRGEGGVFPWLQWLHREHQQELLAVPGVAGMWTYGTTPTWTVPEHWQGPQQYNTVVYLDADPIETFAALVPVLETRWASGVVRPVFAGPLRTMMTWDAWPA